MEFKRITIIGGGASIKDGESKGLWERLKNETTIATNYVYKYLSNPTIFSFVDYSFFAQNRYEIYKMPLVMTKLCPQLKKEIHQDIAKKIILFPESRHNYLGPDSFIRGVYSPKLVGLFSMTIAVQLGFKEIYLLGMDFGSIDNQTTHFYEETLKHRGVGFKYVNSPNRTKTQKRYATNLYDRDPNQYFNCYKNEMTNINIINVSPQSRINTFPKITYDEYFKKLDEEPIEINQSEMRSEMLKVILQKIKATEERSKIENIIKGK